MITFSLGILFISDVYTGSFDNYIGVSWRIISILSLTVLYLHIARNEILSERTNLIVSSIALILSQIIFGSSNFISNPWKYGLAVPTVIFVFTLFSYVKKGKYLQRICALVLCGFSLLNGARSIALICFLTMILSFLPNRDLQKKPGKLKFNYLFAPVLVIIAAQIAFFAYSNQVAKGSFGETQRVKWIAQHNNQAKSFIFIARPELPVSLCILSRNAVLGIGTKAKVEPQERDACIEFSYNLGVYLNSNERMRIFPNSDQFNAHSMLFSYLVFGGLLQLPLWIMILVYIISLLIKEINGNKRNFSYIFMCLTSISDILFSPFTERYSIIIASIIGKVLQMKNYNFK
jgi:hypothetical protein